MTTLLEFGFIEEAEYFEKLRSESQEQKRKKKILKKKFSGEQTKLESYL